MKSLKIKIPAHTHSGISPQGWMNLGSTALSLVGQAINSNKLMQTLPDTTAEEGALEEIRRAGSQLSNSYEDAQNLFDSTKFARTNYKPEELRGITPGQAAGYIIGDTISQGVQGFKAGASTGNMWAAIGGGIAGLITGSLGSGIGYWQGNQKASRKATQFNDLGTLYNDSFVQNMEKNTANIANINKNNDLASLSAFGGPLHSGNFDNGVRFITEGGSHEQNPFGGVLQGIAADGLPNLVEEGEVIYNDYVYSKRLRVPELDKEMLGLKPNKDYTYAEAAEFIQRPSEERPNDHISKRNLDAMMERLQDSQEVLKQKRQAAKIKREFNKLTPEEQMGILMAMQPQEEQTLPVQTYGYANGGIIDRKHQGPWEDPYTSRLMIKRGEKVDTNDEFSYPPVYDAYNNLYLDFGPNREALSTTAGPKKVPTQVVQTPQADKVTVVTGPQDKEQPEPERTKISPYREPMNTQLLRNMPVTGALLGTMMAFADNPDYSNIKRAESKYLQIPRVSPIPIGGKLTYNPLDVHFIGNQLANKNIGVRRAIQEGSAGNRAVAAGNLLYANTLGQNEYADAFIKAMQQNQLNKSQVAQYNSSIDQYNARQQFAANMANQQRDDLIAEALLKTGQLRSEEKARVQAARSATLTNLFNQLGNLGTDRYNRSMTNWLANTGAFHRGAEVGADISNGGIDWGSIINMFKGFGAGGSGAYGGKLTKKGGRHA